jgi:hypothetical protein
MDALRRLAERMKCNQTLVEATLTGEYERDVDMRAVAQIQAIDHAKEGEGRAWWLVSPHLSTRWFGILDLQSAAPCKK